MMLSQTNKSKDRQNQFIILTCTNTELGNYKINNLNFIHYNNYTINLKYIATFLGKGRMHMHPLNSPLNTHTHTHTQCGL